ncbi:MAG: restriction endonuclease subunit S [Chloroflexi bacterium]|nr:restriction endonuclease subunit S [Chloroflexota bacterium]
MTERLQLPGPHREQLEELLREHLPDVEVWAYGSRVDGRSHDGSALDLVLRGPGLKEIDLTRLADFEQALHDSTIPFLVEARDWARLPERFHGEIEREYVVFRLGTGAAKERGWRPLPFSEAVQVNPLARLEQGREYPYVSMADVTAGNRSVSAHVHRIYAGGGSRFRSGDTLMARITPCLENGKIGRYGSEGQPVVAHGSTEFIVVRGRPGVTDSDFTFYLTRWEEVRAYAIGQMTGTSGRQRVPTGSLAHLLVSVPPLDEQRRMAHILGTLDDKIELNQRMSETLDAMVRALFESWFVSFDPVRARTRDGDPDVLERVAGLFPDSFAGSEVGDVPSGWEVVPLTEIMDVNPARRLRKGDLSAYLGMSDMPTRGHAPSRPVTRRPYGSGMRFVNGDTLLARITPCLENGKTAYVDFLATDETGWGSTEYIVMRPKPPLPTEFAYCLARSSAFRHFAIQNMTGTSGRQRVSATALSHFRLPAPPVEIAAEFGVVAGDLLNRASLAARESQALRALREALLPALLSGSLRVDGTRELRR